MIINHYSILGISPNASDAEIKTAFKTLAKKYHPDKNAGNPQAEEAFKKINTAYQTLSDKAKRARYDYILSYQALKKQSTTAPSPNPTQRNRAPQPQRKPSAPPPKNIKYTISVVIAFVLFGSGVLYLSKYMNKKAAVENLKEGIAYENNLKILMAIEKFSQAIENDPSLTESYTRRAWLRFKYLNDTIGAIKDFEEAISNNEKKDYNIFFEAAKFRFKIKKYQDGITLINEAIVINPSFDSLYLYKAEVYNYILKNYEEAITSYSKTLKINNKMHDALFGRALAKQNSGKLVESLNDFNQLIHEVPDNGTYYYYRSWTKRNMKDMSGSCNDIKKSIELGFNEAVVEFDSLCAL